VHPLEHHGAHPGGRPNRRLLLLSRRDPKQQGQRALDSARNNPQSKIIRYQSRRATHVFPKTVDPRRERLARLRGQHQPQPTRLPHRRNHEHKLPAPQQTTAHTDTNQAPRTDPAFGQAHISARLAEQSTARLTLAKRAPPILTPATVQDPQRIDSPDRLSTAAERHPA